MKRFQSQLILLSSLVLLSCVLPAVVFAQPEIQKGRDELKNRVERFHEAKKETKSSSLARQKDVLLQAIDSLAKHGELLQERLVQFPIMDEDLRTSLDKEIHTDIKQLADFRLRAQNATTLEELRGLADELKAHRKETIEEKIRKQMVLAQIELFEQRVLETASTRAILIQETLPNTTEASELLTDANSKITETSTTLQTLKQDVRAKEINNKTMSEVRSTLKTATNTMREVYKIFRAITNFSSPR